ncbi:MAG: hypothetical protein R3F61_02045 [Myxococcota bacterium]
MRWGLGMVAVAGCASSGSGPAEPAVLVREGITPCASDAECGVWYNGCFETAKCWHTDDVGATPDLVCDPPDYAEPVEVCVCDGTCVVVP